MTHMFHTTHRITPGLALTTIALLAAGCHRNTSSSAVVLQGGQTARVVIQGRDPFVEIRNTGPDRVHLDIRDADAAESRELADGAAFGWGTSNGPIRIDLNTGPDQDATVRFRTQRAQGLSIDHHARPNG